MTRFLIVLILVFTGCTRSYHEGPENEEHSSSADVHTQHTTVLSPGEPALGAMSLYQLDTPWTDHTGSERDLSSFAGIPALFAMTYTSCQVSCPVILADLKRIGSRLEEADVEARIVLLSLDPERDSVETLAAFKQDKQLSERWILMRAPDDQVREMAALLGVSYRQTPDGEISHSNIISVLDAKGALVYQQLGQGAGKSDETARFLLHETH